MKAEPRILVDGRPAEAADFRHQALVNYGAYTSFCVENGAARGLSLHIARLQAASMELFGATLGEPDLRAWMRAALAGRDQAFLRVSLFSPQVWPRDPCFTGRPSVMTAAFDAPPPLSDRPLTVQPQIYERDAPHLKSVATFGLMRARRRAVAEGFDDALFVDADGAVSEGTLWNLGLWRGDQLVWPRAPMLAGVTQALLRAQLGGSDERVTLDDLAGLDAAFLCNSATPACAISRIGEATFAPAPERIAALEAAWLAAPQEPI